MNNFGILKDDSPFFPIFEGGKVPIKNILMPNQAECLGDGVQDVYMVDLEKLTADQFAAVARMVHLQCDPSTPFVVAKAEMRERGLPLRAKHVRSVSSDLPFFYRYERERIAVEATAAGGAGLQGPTPNAERRTSNIERVFCAANSAGRGRSGCAPGRRRGDHRRRVGCFRQGKR